ncbi:MAG: hypothetical protein CL845_09290 [Crocinitomicaceae bacterium]|nr:hypothetical protein [Crocinitomicaceae bacterium]
MLFFSCIYDVVDSNRIEHESITDQYQHTDCTLSKRVNPETWILWKLASANLLFMSAQND